MASAKLCSLAANRRASLLTSSPEFSSCVHEPKNWGPRRLEGLWLGGWQQILRSVEIQRIFRTVNVPGATLGTRNRFRRDHALGDDSFFVVRVHGQRNVHPACHAFDSVISRHASMLPGTFYHELGQNHESRYFRDLTGKLCGIERLATKYQCKGPCEHNREALFGIALGKVTLVRAKFGGEDLGSGEAL